MRLKHLEMVYHTFILPHLEYGSILFANETYLSKLDRIHYRAGHLVSGCVHGTNTNKVLGSLGWMSLSTQKIVDIVRSVILVPVNIISQGSH
jgi:hypothetical protein